MLVPLMVKGLSTKIGQDNAITNSKIRSRLKDKELDISDSRIRKIINYIRVNKLIVNLLATSKGYFISNDPNEISRYKESLIARANSILNLAKSYEI
ncbi:MAG: hypothetical protein K9G64_09070 [Bacteroidia bacterium]|nr:hypothetical protein [Bacteroidia bacterium]